RVTRRARPGNRRVASRYAAGVPARSVSANAIPFVFAVTASASRTTRSSSRASSAPGETRRKIASIGSSRKPSATAVAAPARTLKAARLKFSSLDHHRGRLDDRGRALPRAQAELLGRLARDDRDDAGRLGDVELDLREQALDPHLAHDAAEVVAGARALAGFALQPGDLR